jgi:hypothetical protein
MVYLLLPIVPESRRCHSLLLETLIVPIVLLLKHLLLRRRAETW